MQTLLMGACLAWLSACNFSREVVGDPGVTEDPKSEKSRADAVSFAGAQLSVSASSVDPGDSVDIRLVVDGATSGGAAVLFRASGGTSTGTISSTTDNGDGSYTATFTGVRSGSATTLSAYVEGEGAFDSTVDVSVNFLAAPSALSFSTPSPNYANNVEITANVPTVTGVVETYTVSPSLPTGLSLDPLTGRITGTPTVTTASAAYTVTATNPLGTATAVLNIRVLPPAPSGLSYSTLSASYARLSAITPNTPTVTGTVDSYSVSPALPTGLSLHATTGVISGTPSVVTASATYTVTAMNAGGSTTASVVIVVVPRPPTSLSYGTVASSYVRLTAITQNSATAGGGDAPYTYTVSPALPTGLALNSTTGAVTGTPSLIQSLASYTVTAANSGGSVSTVIQIEVRPRAPTAISYSTANPVYERAVAISNNNATVTNGDPTLTYSISPSLPLGLNFDTGTGRISGTPTVVAASQSYVITVANTGGSTSVVMNLRVTSRRPTTIAYAGGPTFNWTADEAITTITPTLATGDAPVTWAVSPALPAGLSFDTTTGAVSGNPSVAQASTVHAITATNDGGSASYNFTLEVWKNQNSTEFVAASSDVASTGVGFSSVLSSSVTNFTVQLWMRGRSVPGVGDGVLGATNGASNGIGLFWSAFDTLRFYVNNPVNYVEAAGLDGTAWNHVVGTYSTTGVDNVKLYVNGVLAPAYSHNATISSLTELVAIGNLGSSGAQTANAHIDEVAFWNVAQSAAAVTSLYNGGAPINLKQSRGAYTYSAAALRAYWRMGDADTFPTLTDRGASGRNLTMGGGMSGASISTDVP